jgi:hypothetical protein
VHLVGSHNMDNGHSWWKVLCFWNYELYWQLIWRYKAVTNCRSPCSVNLLLTTQPTRWYAWRMSTMQIIDKIYCAINTDHLSGPLHQGFVYPGHQVIRWLNIVSCCQVFVGPRHRTCSVSAFWHLEFWGGS